MDSLLLTQETALKVYTNYGNHRGGISYADEVIRTEVDHFVWRLIPPSPRDLELTQRRNRIMASYRP
jgi:hypothetical protein